MKLTWDNVTPKADFLNRRQLMQGALGLGAGMIGAGVAGARAGRGVEAQYVRRDHDL